jgi:hypothetical protein
VKNEKRAKWLRAAVTSILALCLSSAASGQTLGTPQTATGQIPSDVTGDNPLYSAGANPYVLYNLTLTPATALVCTTYPTADFAIYNPSGVLQGQWTTPLYQLLNGGTDWNLTGMWQWLAAGYSVKIGLTSAGAGCNANAWPMSASLKYISPDAVAPGSLAFGWVPVGQTSATQTLTIANANTGGGSLTVYPPTVPAGWNIVSVSFPGGQLPPDLYFLNGANQQECPLSGPYSLLVGNWCQYNVSFQPALSQPYTGNAAISTSAGSLNVPLTGTGVPNVSPPPGVQTVSGQLINELPPYPEATLVPWSGQPWLLLSATVATSNAVPLNCTGSTPMVDIAPGSAEVSLTNNQSSWSFPAADFPALPLSGFNITTSIMQAGVGCNDTVGGAFPLTVTLNYINPVIVDPGPVLNFGDIPATQVSQPQTVTIANMTGAPFLLSPLVLGDSSDFSVELDSGTPPPELSFLLPANQVAGSGCVLGTYLYPSQWCQALLYFHPLLIQDYSTNLTIPTTAGTEYLGLSGTGIAYGPSASVDPSAVNFGDKPIGSTTPVQNVVLQNAGNAPLTITSIVLGDTSDFHIAANSCGGYLAINGSCQVSVTFSPTQTQPYHTTLTFNTNDPINPAIAVNLTGTGVNDWTQVQAHTLIDLAGNPLNGQLCLQGTDSQNAAVNFRPGSGGQVITRRFCEPVTNGAIPDSSLFVPDSSATSPQNVVYDVTGIDQSNGCGGAKTPPCPIVLEYRGVYITGSLFFLDNYQPPPQQLPLNWAGAAPAGGASGTVLTKNSGANYDYSWLAGGSGQMIYPATGVPNSTGTAWGTSYSASNPIPSSIAPGAAGTYPGAGIANSTGSGWGTSYSSSVPIPAADIASGYPWSSLTGLPNLVNSFNGRAGAVTPASGDYTAAQVTNAAAINAANTFSSGLIQSMYQIDAESGPIASTGFLNLGRGDTLCWRNWGNTADNCLGEDSSDKPTWNDTEIGGSGGSMVYPGAGIPNSTGSAWGTSYSSGNPIPVSDLASGYAYSSLGGVPSVVGGSSGALNGWQSNYLGSNIGAADFGATAHATGIFIGDSTLAGSNSPQAPASNDATTWVQEIATTGGTPKIAEMLEARFGRASGQNGFGGDGWISTFTSLTAGGQAVPANASVVTTAAPNIVFTAHDGVKALCPDMTVGQDNTIGDIVTYSDNLATAMTFYALGQPNGGSFEVSVDGGAYSSAVSTANAAYGGTLYSYAATGLTLGPHTLAVKVTALGTGNIGVGYCGVRAQDTDQAATFEPQKWAAGGAELNQWNAIPTGVLSALGLDPSFVLIQSGHNEYANGDRTPAQVAADYHTAMGKAQSLWPNASIIYVLSHSDSRSSGSSATYDQYMQAIRQQAMADNVTLVDLYDSTKNFTQLANWANCPFAGASAGACKGIHLNDNGNAWASALLYSQLTNNLEPLGSGYLWNFRQRSGSYTLSCNDFSSPNGKGRILEPASFSVTYTLPSAPCALGSAVRIQSHSTGTATVTINSGSAPIDGATTATTPMTIAPGQYVELVTSGTSGAGGYESFGVTSRNAAASGGTIAHTTSVLKGDGSGNAVAATSGTDFVPPSTTVNGHALSSNVTVSASDITTGTLPHAQLPTLLSGDIPNNAANTTGNAATATAATQWNNATETTYRTSWSLSSSTGLLGSPITLLPSTLTTGHYSIFLHLAESSPGVGCSSYGSLRLYLGYQDPDAGLTFALGSSSSYLQGGQLASGTSYTIFNAAGTVSSAQVWTGNTDIYAANGTAVQIQGYASAATAGCSTQPTMQSTVTVVGPW